MASKKMFREERLQLISERLLAGQAVYVDELARDFEVSPSSIRNDLAELEERGLLKRTHGGAIASARLPGRMVTQKSSFELRKATDQAEKSAIGRAAAAMIKAGDTLMIDGGSTTLHVTRHLAGKSGLTIITNAVSLLPDLMAMPEARIYVSGGLLDTQFETLVGEMTADAIGRFRTSKAILGIDGISADGGLSVTDPAVAATKRRMMAASNELIIVADHTKLDQVCLVPVAPLTEVDYLVTDSGAPADLVEAIRAYGPKVIVAPVETTGGDKPSRNTA